MTSSFHIVDRKGNSFGRAIYLYDVIVPYFLDFIVTALMLLKMCHRKSWLYCFLSYVLNILQNLHFFAFNDVENLGLSLWLLYFCAILTFSIGFDYFGSIWRFLRGFEMSGSLRRRIQNGGCAELITQFPRHMTPSFHCADTKETVLDIPYTL